MIQTKPENIWRTATGGMRNNLSLASVLLALSLIVLLGPGALAITMNPNYDNQDGGPLYKPAVEVNQDLRVHRVSNVYFSVTNYGKFGSDGRDLYDPETNELAPSCEFPAGTNIEYLFQGAIWIGGVVDDTVNVGELDTLVSIGSDGWWSVCYELNPTVPPEGQFLELSSRGVNAPPYADTIGTVPELDDRSFTAISEQDFISTYTDTVTIGISPDPCDSRAHRPLGLRVVQKSYAWSYEYAEDFVLIDFEIDNIGIQDIVDMWIGLYIDADVYHITEPEGYNECGAQDDICGYLKTDPTDDRIEINTAWIADNDGHPFDPEVPSTPLTPGDFLSTSPRGVSGCRVVRAPSQNGELEYGFNWWISNIDATLDWGPVWEEHDRVFGGGGRGTPGGDASKYYVMANGEFDYDQIYCDAAPAQDSAGHTWGAAPSGTDLATLANGYDTRYLYSFGSFPALSPDNVLSLTVAYVCGNNLHVDPTNLAENLFSHTDDSTSIATYYNNLDFDDFATNAKWAEWVYDNPGRDSCWNEDTQTWDLDGERGTSDTTISGADTSITWLTGDGCADFQGPPPPYSPILTVEASKGSVTLVWPGINVDAPATGPEDCLDSFNGQKDFEGYAIYMSTDEIDWAMLGRFDKVDWVPVTWDDTVDPAVWITNKRKMYPISTDSVIALGGEPGVWSDDHADTNWVANDLNTGLEEILDSTLVVTIDGDSVAVNYYSFTISGLSSATGTYFAVTSFDFGDPQTDLSSLESAQSINSNLVYPIDKTEPINVYPNPYKITDTQEYIDMGYEDPNNEGWDEQDRRIWFSNLPDEYRAFIRIWTLDGDLVRILNYDPTEFIGNPSGIIYWDLVSRNGQAVVSGLYLYSIEFVPVNNSTANRDSEIGKFVIIK